MDHWCSGIMASCAALSPDVEDYTRREPCIQEQATNILHLATDSKGCPKAFRSLDGWSASGRSRRTTFILLVSQVPLIMCKLHGLSEEYSLLIYIGIILVIGHLGY